MRGKRGILFWDVVRPSQLLSHIRHVVLPDPRRIIPDDAVRLVPFLSVAKLLRPLARALFLVGLVLVLESILVKGVVEFIRILKIPEVFRVESLTPAFIARVGGWISLLFLCLVGIDTVRNFAAALTTSLYLSARELCILSTLPFGADSARIPLRSVERIAFRQFPGERILGTGSIEIRTHSEILVFPGVPSVERTAAEISDAVQSL